MTTMSNPLDTYRDLPPFDLIASEHIVPALEKALGEIHRDFSTLEANIYASWEGLLRPLEKMQLRLQRVWSPVSHLYGVKNSPTLRAAYEQMQGPVVALSLKMSQSKAVYEGLQQIRESANWASLSPGQQRAVEGRLRDAQLAGISLAGPAQKRFIALTTELSALATKFSNNVLDATKQFTLSLSKNAEVDGLPFSLLQGAAQAYQRTHPTEQADPQHGPWLITLDAPSFVPFMENSTRRDLREQLYRAYITRASAEPFDNSGHIIKMLQLRHEQAQLLGFSNYAEMSLAQKMAPSVEAVYTLLEQLRENSWEGATHELTDITARAVRGGFQQPLAQWDISYWAKRLQEERFEFNDEELRGYFPLPSVLQGMFALVENLFGIRVEAADGQAAIWHKDVRFFKIFSQEQQHLASFYLDPFSRPEDKRSGAWMDDCRSRYRDSDGVLSLPVAHLVCNMTPPVGEAPSLLNFNEVETLFHEFGHGLQHMLSEVDYLDVSGINGIEWDAVELPSQFMENWCYHKPTLMGMARHYQSAEPLPEALFTKLNAAKTFRAGQMMLRQVQFALLDLRLHHSFDPFAVNASPFALQAEVSSATSLLPPLAEDRFLCSFSHIFCGGYAAGYYSYKWAEVLSADAFNAFEEAGLDQPEIVSAVGKRFRQTILALGGSIHPLTVFTLFRGRGPRIEPLLLHSGLCTLNAAPK